MLLVDCGRHTPLQPVPHGSDIRCLLACSLSTEAHQHSLHSSSGLPTAAEHDQAIYSASCAELRPATQVGWLLCCMSRLSTLYACSAASVQALLPCAPGPSYKRHSAQAGLPANVPAVLETPMSSPACAGAMSMWFTENPPRAKAALPSAHVVANTPMRVPLAAAMPMSASAAPQKPAQ